MRDAENCSFGTEILGPEEHARCMAEDEARGFSVWIIEKCYGTLWMPLHYAEYVYLHQYDAEKNMKQRLKFFPKEKLRVKEYRSIIPVR